MFDAAIMTLGSTGHVVIPEAIRERLGLKTVHSSGSWRTAPAVLLRAVHRE